MTDHQDLQPEVSPKPPGSGRIVAAGVVGALALGAGMGLWARPAPPQPIQIKSMAPEDAPRPALQIIVDDSPAPIGALLEVLPGDFAADAEPTPPAPEIVAPRRPAAGLMKVDAVVAVEPLLVPTAKVEKPKPKTEPKPKPTIQKAKVEPKPKPETPKVAQVTPKKSDKAKAAEKVRLAKVEKARAEKLAKAEKVEKAKALKLAQARKAEKAKAVKLAQAETKKQKAAKAKSVETKRLAALARTQKPAPKVLKAETSRKKKVELAQAKAAKKARVERASAKTVVAKAPARKPPVRRPAAVGEGPMRVAGSDTCASPDFGQAVVCADRRLGARDRQLQQAYRNAEAAGVPASSLQRQQARWLQARAAAAREAPWAVEDVYVARISELNDLTRDAREN